MSAAAPDAAEIRTIRLLVFDFDGVFTDNTVWVDETGKESVRCWRSDGLGLSRLRATGLDMMVLSTEPNPAVAMRCRKLNMPCEHGIADKAARLAEIASAKGVDPSQIAFVGNDTNDLGCLEFAGLPITVADADPRVVPLARYQTSRPGGFGAVREVCDLFADARQSQP